MKNEERLFEGKSRDYERGRSGNILIAIFITIIVLFIAGFAYYILIQFKPINIYKMAIEGFSSYLQEDIFYDRSAIEIREDGKYVLGVEAKAYLESDEANYLKIATSLGFDMASEDFSLKALLESKGTSILDLAMYGVDGVSYIESKKLYDRIISIGEYDVLESNEDVYTPTDGTAFYRERYFIEAIKNYTIGSLDESKFSTSDAKVNANGIIREATRYTYTIDKDMQKEYVTGLVDLILSDETLSNVAIIYGFNKDKLLELKNRDYSQNKDISIDLYSHLRNIYGIDVSYDGIKIFKFYKIEEGIEIGLSFDIEETAGDQTATHYQEDAILILGALKEDKLYLRLVINDNTGSTNLGSLTVNEYSDSKIDCDMMLYLLEGEDPLEMSITVTTSCEEDKNISSTINMTLKYGGQTIIGEATSGIKLVDDLEIPSFEDAVDIDDITDEEFMSIANKLQNAANGTVYEELFQLLGSYLTGDLSYFKNDISI